MQARAAKRPANPMTNERHAAIGLGSNMGDRLGYLNRALALLDRHPAIAVVSTARIHHSKGWGRDNLKPFLNTALAVRTTLGAAELLHEMQRIENALGRQRTLKWGPRTLDLDLLAMDGEVHATSELQVPHPYIAERPFVYMPMRELVALCPSWEPLVQPSAEGQRIAGDTWTESEPVPAWGARREPAARVEWVSQSEDATLAFARSLAAFLLPGDIVALDAPMGSGKSVFARGLARGLGIEGPVQSPTFTVCRRYEAGPVPFEHWDFYRLGSEDDLESTGFFASESVAAIRAIEWADMFPHAVGKALLRVTLEPLDADRRRIVLESPTGRLPFAAQVLAEARR